MLLTVLLLKTLHFIMFLIDINDCFPSKGGCDHYCTNNNGTFTCSCQTGYILDVDGVTCDGK